MKRVFICIIFVLLISACSVLEIGTKAFSLDPANESVDGFGMETSMGPGSGMMNRHHVMIPDEYAGLSNPIPSDGESLARGSEIYSLHCATCHGDYGNGDGPGGASLDPAPAPIAHTSQMMSDAYLFWRITEGGVPFGTGMVPYLTILINENEIWDVINYVHALGSGRVQPGSEFGGKPFDPVIEQAQRTDMLIEAVKNNVLSQEEADTFNQVHAVMDEFFQTEDVSGFGSKTSRSDSLPQILETLLENGKVTEKNATIFLDVHDRLVDSGLME